MNDIDNNDIDGNKCNVIERLWFWWWYCKCVHDNHNWDHNGNYNIVYYVNNIVYYKTKDRGMKKQVYLPRSHRSPLIQPPFHHHFSSFSAVSAPHHLSGLGSCPHRSHNSHFLPSLASCAHGFLYYDKKQRIIYFFQFLFACYFYFHMVSIFLFYFIAIKYILYSILNIFCILS